jgi:hypothetical protein
VEALPGVGLGVLTRPCRYPERPSTDSADVRSTRNSRLDRYLAVTDRQHAGARIRHQDVAVRSGVDPEDRPLEAVDRTAAVGAAMITRAADSGASILDFFI